jgi:hypothetical protein
VIETSVRFAVPGFAPFTGRAPYKADRIDAPGEEDAMARPPRLGGLS